MNQEPASPVPDDAACSACEELRREVAHLMTEKVKLHAECQKYRVALNRVAHPETWGVNPGHHVEIARRALVIGMKVIPKTAADLTPQNDQGLATQPAPQRPELD